MDRGWCIVEAHPWNLLGKFDLFVHPWKFGLFVLCVGRLKHVLQASESVEVGIIFRVLNSLNGIPQFCKCIDNGIRGRDHWLRDIFVPEKHSVRESFCSCLLAKNHVRPVVLLRRFQIESIARMLTKRFSSTRFDVELYGTTHGGNRHAIVVETPVVVCISGDVGSHVRLTQ